MQVRTPSVTDMNGEQAVLFEHDDRYFTQVWAAFVMVENYECSINSVVFPSSGRPERTMEVVNTPHEEIPRLQTMIAETQVMVTPRGGILLQVNRSLEHAERPGFINATVNKRMENGEHTGFINAFPATTQMGDNTSGVETRF